MTAKFDAYHEWLGIPPEEQPPHHYQLLGLKLFETNRSAISNAADRQMAHVRTFAGGKNAAASQKLLNELAAAARCLLGEKSREAYDTVLKSAMPADISSADPTPTGAKPAAPAAAVETSAPLNAYGPYQVVERLAGSSLGTTYKVRDNTGRFFSLKTLSAEQAKNAEVLQRFRREIEIVMKLDHSNLIAGVDTGEVNGVPYLVTEFVVGTDLATLVKQQGPLPVDVAIEYILQAAKGLTQLHLHGVFHRNLKPHVLMVDMQGRLRITNLLLARIAASSELNKGEELTRMGEMMGSVEYQPPEQASNAAGVDGRADIYALGCTLHHLLTGQPPYLGKSLMEKLLAHRQRPIPSLVAARNDTPPELDAVFQKMLAKEPSQRYQFIGELIDALEKMHAPSGKGKAKGEKAEFPWLYIAIGGGVLLVAILGWLMFR